MTYFWIEKRPCRFVINAPKNFSKKWPENETYFEIRKIFLGDDSRHNKEPKYEKIFLWFFENSRVEPP